MEMSKILDKIPLGIIIFDESNQVIAINHSGKLYFEKTNNYLLEIVTNFAARTFKSKFSVEKIIQYINAYNLYVWRIKTELLNASSPQVMVIIEDETITYQLKQTVLKAEKLAVAGQLALGSLVEIRNPLTSARGFCQLIEQSEVHKEYIEIISKELEQIKHIVNNCSLLTNTAKANNFELIYKKLLTCINNQIDCNKLMLVRDDFNNVVINAAEEQINILITNLITLLNSWVEENAYIIINSELAEEASYLQLNIRAHSDILNRRNGINKTIESQICNNINLEILNSNTLAVILQLPIIIQQYPH